MRRICALFLIGSVLAIFVAPGHSLVAEDKGESKINALKTYGGKVANKMKIGAVNVVRAPAEFFIQPMDARHKSGDNVSMLWPGLGEASGMFLTRLFAGIIDVATSAVPFPKPHWEPFMNE